MGIRTRLCLCGVEPGTFLAQLDFVKVRGELQSKLKLLGSCRIRVVFGLHSGFGVRVELLDFGLDMGFGGTHFNLGACVVESL